MPQDQQTARDEHKIAQPSEGYFKLAAGSGEGHSRVWSGPPVPLSHLGTWATAVFAAASAVLVNNRPAASLLAAQTPEHHPLALLTGLNLGPNLFVTGSCLATVARGRSDCRGTAVDLPASRMGLIAVPLSMAAARAALSAARPVPLRLG